MIDPPDRLSTRCFSRSVRRSPICRTRCCETAIGYRRSHPADVARAPRVLLAVARAFGTRESEMIERFTQAGCLARRRRTASTTCTRGSSIRPIGGVAGVGDDGPAVQPGEPREGSVSLASGAPAEEAQRRARRLHVHALQHHAPQAPRRGGADPRAARVSRHGLSRFQFGPYAQSKPPVVLAVARLVEKKGSTRWCARARACATAAATSAVTSSATDRSGSRSPT